MSGAGAPLTKSRGWSFVREASASEMGAIYHLNPKPFFPLLYESAQNAFSLMGPPAPDLHPGPRTPGLAMAPF